MTTREIIIKAGFHPSNIVNMGEGKFGIKQRYYLRFGQTANNAKILVSRYLPDFELVGFEDHYDTFLLEPKAYWLTIVKPKQT